MTLHFLVQRVGESVFLPVSLLFLDFHSVNYSICLSLTNCSLPEHP